MTDISNERSVAGSRNGVALHRFSHVEYQRLMRCGVIGRSEPVELVDGLIALTAEARPPYGMPVGIPPEILLEGDHLLDRRPLRRLTVPELDKLVNAGAIEPEVRFELAEGWVVDKMVRNRKHDSTLTRLIGVLTGSLPQGYILRSQMSVTLDESKFEPDAAIVLGPLDRYDERHPTPSEVLLLVEVAHSTLRFDRGIKLRSYARNSVETYWLVNLVKDCVEVYSKPSGPTNEPEYASCVKHGRGESIAIFRGRRKMLQVAVSDLLKK